MRLGEIRTAEDVVGEGPALERETTDSRLGSLERSHGNSLAALNVRRGALRFGDAGSGRAQTLRELAPDERPRERLLENGAASLSDSELIAILLRTGCRGVSAIDLARRLLAAAGGLAGLCGVDRHLLRARGVGPAKEATLLAAVELATRIARAEVPERHALHRPAAAARYLTLRYGRRDQEIMGALYLDSRHRLISERELFRGTINRAAVEPRAVLKEGLFVGAAGFLLFHTHPSGDPAPSAEDLAFTKRLLEAGEVVGLRLVDHLILGHGERWVSLRERGAW